MEHEKSESESLFGWGRQDTFSLGLDKAQTLSQNQPAKAGTVMAHFTDGTSLT